MPSLQGVGAPAWHGFMSGRMPDQGYQFCDDSGAARQVVAFVGGFLAEYLIGSPPGACVSAGQVGALPPRTLDPS